MAGPACPASSIHRSRNKHHEHFQPATGHPLCARHLRSQKRAATRRRPDAASAPSIFAEHKHASRSERYSYIPTAEVLRGLRKEGFEPFMVAQSKSRIEGKTEFTKHMIRIYCQLRTMSTRQ